MTITSANYNCGVMCKSPTTDGSNENITDLGNNLTSCWSPTGDESGRQLTKEENNDYYNFPSTNFTNCYAGQLITINNPNYTELKIYVDSNTKVFFYGDYYMGSSFILGGNSTVVLMLFGGNLWMQLLLNGYPT